ncbi:hypothetical protein QE364_003986 [Nocardioides zeae]|uniref:Uncharacterized protein n=1 Tax=Nocardioides zeae TaxID=1457234 RepID=A0ACC6IND5_9ACTN|nr:hypothetical protein [Nocardioides zeae]MDR6173386.1 hypothetical protein [Nocardioides zeae]MDR6212251.1 hypothetical protein [Nocardioides zeae]
MAAVGVVIAAVLSPGAADDAYGEDDVAFLTNVQRTSHLMVVVPQHLPHGYVLARNAGVTTMNGTSTVELRFAPRAEGLPFVSVCTSDATDIYEACARRPQRTDRVVRSADRHDTVLIRSTEPASALPVGWSAVRLVPIREL